MARGHKRMPFHAEAPETIACQLEAFRKKFGREPCPDDPIFFDPDANEPVPLNPQQYEQDMIETMAQAGINPAFIYAFKRTGRIVTESNKHLLTPEELRQWNDAVDEYHRRVALEVARDGILVNAIGGGRSPNRQLGQQHASRCSPAAARTHKPLGLI